MDGIPVDSILKCIDGLDRAEIEALKINLINRQINRQEPCGFA